MTNYTIYPKWLKRGFLMCFAPDKYSWCNASITQARYLLNSSYLNNIQTFVYLNTGEVFKDIFDIRSFLLEFCGDA